MCCMSVLRTPWAWSTLLYDYRTLYTAACPCTTCSVYVLFHAHWSVKNLCDGFTDTCPCLRNSTSEWRIILMQSVNLWASIQSSRTIFTLRRSSVFFSRTRSRACSSVFPALVSILVHCTLHCCSAADIMIMCNFVHNRVKVCTFTHPWLLRIWSSLTILMT